MKLIPAAALVAGGVTNQHALHEQFEKIFNVTQVTAVQVEVNDIAKLVYLDSFDGSDPKNQEDFVVYVRKNMLTKVGQTRDTSKDFWGTEYRLERANGQFKVISAGPDKTFGTDDDIYAGYQL